MSAKVDFSNLTQEEIAKVILVRINLWCELYKTKNFDEIRSLYCPSALILPPGQGPYHGPDGAVASQKVGHELGMAVAVRISTEADVLGPDTAVTVSTWEWYSADDVKGGTAKDITIWKYHEGDWRIFKEIFNMP